MDLSIARLLQFFVERNDGFHLVSCFDVVISFLLDFFCMVYI